MPKGEQRAASKGSEDQRVLRAAVDADEQRPVGLGFEQFRGSFFEEADPCESFHERRLLRARDR